MDEVPTIKRSLLLQACFFLSHFFLTATREGPPRSLVFQLIELIYNLLYSKLLFLSRTGEFFRLWNNVIFFLTLLPCPHRPPLSLAPCFQLILLLRVVEVPLTLFLNFLSPFLVADLFHSFSLSSSSLAHF